MRVARASSVVLAVLSAALPLACKPSSTPGEDGGKPQPFVPSIIALDPATFDGGVPKVVPTSLEGTVSLPPGFQQPLEQLEIRALLGRASVSSTGHFMVQGVGTKRQGVQLLDRQDNLIALGWATAGTPAVISSKSTAAFFLFFYAGAPFYPPAAWNSIIELLLAAPETATLGTVLDEKLVQNPKYLSLSTPEDQASFAQAVGEALGKLTSLATRKQPLVLVNPADKKSGVTVLVGDKDGTATSDVNQVTFMNEWRRRLWVTIERQSGDTYVRDQDFELAPTSGLNGVIGSITDVMEQKGAYTPVYQGPVSLGTPLTEDEVIRYRVRVLGNGQPSGIALTPEQLGKKQFVSVKALLVDLFIPGLFSLMEFDWLGNLFGSAYFGEFVKEMTNQVYNGGLLDLGNLLTAGDLWGALNKFGSILQNNSTWRDWLLENFRIMLIHLFNSEEVWKFSHKASTTLLSAMAVVDRVLAVADLVAVTRDSAAGSDVEEWMVSVRAPKVIVTPARAQVSCGERTAFTVSVKNAGQLLATNMTYKLESAPSFGHFTTPINSSYKDIFEITRPEFFYTVDPGIVAQEGQDEAVISVSAVVDSKTKLYLGKAKFTAQVGQTCTSTPGYVGSGAFTSGCTHALSVPSVVHPGDEVTVTAKSGYGGVCGTSFVWMSFATSVSLDGAPPTSGGGGRGIYDFCYGGGPQPLVPPGAGVALPDGETHTLKFKIDNNLKCPVCVKENLNGSPCSSNSGNRKTVSGPAVVMGGTGGTHGWSTVRFFTVEIPR